MNFNGSGRGKETKLLRSLWKNFPGGSGSKLRNSFVFTNTKLFVCEKLGVGDGGISQDLKNETKL